MDALDLLVDFASFLADSTAIPMPSNAEIDAQKTAETSTSIKHESPTNMSIEQANHPVMDHHALSPRGSLPIEVFLPQAPRAEQPGGNNELPNLNTHPILVHSGRAEGPGSYVEPYAIEHATTVWNPQSFPDDQSAPPSWVNMHEFGPAMQPDKLAWAPYPPLFHKIPRVNGIGEMVVAGDGIYQPPCGMGLCNCQDFPPEFASPVSTPAYEQYEAGSLFVVLPGTTDNFVSNERIALNITSTQIWSLLANISKWESYYKNCSTITPPSSDTPFLHKGDVFKFSTFGFPPLTCTVEESEAPESNGRPGRLAWSSKIDEGVEVYHAWLVEDLEGQRVRVLTQESQIGPIFKEWEWQKPNKMLLGHQDWLDGLITAASGKAIGETNLEAIDFPVRK